MSPTVIMLTSYTCLASGIATGTDNDGEKLYNHWIGLKQLLMIFQNKG